MVGAAEPDHEGPQDGRPAGGDWRFVASNPDASEEAFRGSYREVTPPERTVHCEWERMRATSASRLAILERDRLLAALACALVVPVATLIPALGALAITAGVCVALVVFETMLPARPRSSPLPGGPSGRRQSASAGRAPSP